ncbi:MAG: (2Fe-2S) ferredoxin domain-containing protein [Elainella sp.]
MGKSSQVEQFSLEGRFLGFGAEGYKLKLMRLTTATGDYTIKLPKELRPLLYRTLTPGDWVQVTGYQKFDDGRVKLKAEQVVPIPANRPTLLRPTVQPVAQTSLPQDADRSMQQAAGSAPTTSTKPQTILVCQKSDCCKRGGSALVRALQTGLAERGLTEQVKICGTGCMKRCKAGPNLVMPDKTRYTRIQAHEVSTLLEQHFPTSVEVAS